MNFRNTLRRDYFKAAFREAGNNQKRLWKIVKQLFGNPKKRSKINTINGRENPKDMADEINQYFADIGPNLAASMSESLLDENYEFSSDREQLDLHETTPDIVKKLLLKI